MSYFVNQASDNPDVFNKIAGPFTASECLDYLAKNNISCTLQYTVLEYNADVLIMEYAPFEFINKRKLITGGI